jgi:hypothetical protein
VQHALHGLSHGPDVTLGALSLQFDAPHVLLRDLPAISVYLLPRPLYCRSDDQPAIEPDQPLQPDDPDASFAQHPEIPFFHSRHLPGWD